MDSFEKFKQFLLGESRNPFNPLIFKQFALIAFFAWIGLGADSLSSSCYGPEQAYLALGEHTPLAIFIAVAVAVTVFIIAVGYMQVIKLFPSGGGGYKVAGVLLHPFLGLVAGSALIVDYIVTITISVTGAVNALFSFFPLSIGGMQLIVEVIVLGLLLLLNLRGIKESIIVLAPIMMGFVITHIALILVGNIAHPRTVFTVVREAFDETSAMRASVGSFAVFALLMHAYSLGAGTYTGLEAVANNVNRLAEPRIRTGKWAMFYLAVSLSITAGGLIFGYLFWQVSPQVGKTLNAVLFHKILGDSLSGQIILFLTLLFEAAILFAAASAGFITGPTILATMAIDDWMPRRFRHLSDHLVMQNGILFFGVAALILLLATRGSIHLLVILYSINVFITFTLAFLGIAVYWWSLRDKQKRWWLYFIFTCLGLMIVAAILSIMIYAKFLAGGWLTLSITLIVIIVGLLIKRHYNLRNAELEKLNQQLSTQQQAPIKYDERIDAQQPTAVFIVSENRGLTLQTLLCCQKLFPKEFKNFIFISTGIVDIKSFRGRKCLTEMRKKLEEDLYCLVNYCQQHHLSSAYYANYGTDVIKNLSKLIDKIIDKYPQSSFFIGKLSSAQDDWFTRFLDEDITRILSQELAERGKQLTILSLKA